MYILFVIEYVHTFVMEYLYIRFRIEYLYILFRMEYLYILFGMEYAYIRQDLDSISAYLNHTIGVYVHTSLMGDIQNNSMYSTIF
jgi:hypothetical protein